MSLIPKTGAFPSPRSALAAAVPHVAMYEPPQNFMAQPNQMSMWGNDQHGDCVTAEEAFAKACNSPEIFIPSDTVVAWATHNKVIAGATLIQVLDLMQEGGFTDKERKYNDGPYFSVDWTNPANLKSAIAQGPVKIGVASAQILESWKRTDGQSGWFGTDYTSDTAFNHCVSLCGYGTLSWLAQQLGVAVPAGVDGKTLGYAMFTWKSIGILNAESMNNITNEAWLRSPTTKTTGQHGLYVFHQGTKDDLWYTVSDGNKWAADKKVSNVGIQNSPSVVSFNGKLYVFHQGMGSDLWYSVFDGATWSADTQLENVGNVTSPSAVVYKNSLYVFHQGMDHDLWYSMFDGTKWSQDTQVLNVSTYDGPSAVVYQGQLYVLHQGSENDLWYSVFDGSKWGPDVHVPGVGISGRPSAVVANNKLCVFHRGNGTSNLLWLTSYNGKTWAPDSLIHNVQMAAGPSAVMVQNEILVFHQGADDLWYSEFNSPSWLADRKIPDVGVMSGPSAVYWV